MDTSAFIDRILVGVHSQIQTDPNTITRNQISFEVPMEEVSVDRIGLLLKAFDRFKEKFQAAPLSSQKKPFQAHQGPDLIAITTYLAAYPLYTASEHGVALRLEFAGALTFPDPENTERFEIQKVAGPVRFEVSYHLPDNTGTNPSTIGLSRKQSIDSYVGFIFGALFDVFAELTLDLNRYLKLRANLPPTEAR